jgi:hypothetical protein
VNVLTGDPLAAQTGTPDAFIAIPPPTSPIAGVGPMAFGVMQLCGGARAKECARVVVPNKCARTWRVTLREPEFSYPFDPRHFSIAWDAGFQKRVYARVTWGEHGVRHVAYVDWRRGCSFCVHGDTVIVEAVWPNAGISALGPSDAPDPVQYLLGANIEPADDSGKNSTCTFSADLGIIDPAAEAAAASLDLDPLTGGDISDVVFAHATGPSGNLITLRAVNDAALPAGSVDVVGTDITWHFKPGASTNVDFETAMAAPAPSALVGVTPGGGGVWNGLGFPAQNLSGGHDAVSGFSGYVVPPYAVGVRLYQWFNSSTPIVPGALLLAGTSDVTGFATRQVHRLTSDLFVDASYDGMTPPHAVKGTACCYVPLESESQWLYVQNLAGENYPPAELSMGIVAEFVLDIG